MTQSIDRRLREILDDLAPSALLETVLLPHERWREDFTPRFLTTSSYEEMIGELGRFVCHMRAQWYFAEEWPLDSGIGDARRLLSREGELAAMSACRLGDHGGLRLALDILMRKLQAAALEQYLESVVMPKIRRLSPTTSLELARAYREEYQQVTGYDLPSPAALAARWTQVIQRHADLVLRMR